MRAAEKAKSVHWRKHFAGGPETEMVPCILTAGGGINQGLSGLIREAMQRVGPRVSRRVQVKTYIARHISVLLRKFACITNMVCVKLNDQARSRYN